MYLESVKDAIPARFGRVERPLSPKNYGTTLDDSAENYEDVKMICTKFAWILG